MRPHASPGSSPRQTPRQSVSHYTLGGLDTRSRPARSTGVSTPTGVAARHSALSSVTSPRTAIGEKRTRFTNRGACTTGRRPTCSRAQARSSAGTMHAATHCRAGTGSATCDGRRPRSMSGAAGDAAPRPSPAELGSRNPTWRPRMAGAATQQVQSVIPRLFPATRPHSWPPAGSSLPRESPRCRLRRCRWASAARCRCNATSPDLGQRENQN